MNLDILISKARKAFEQVDPTDIQVLLGDERVTLRLFPLAGHEWRDLIALYPPRLVAGATEDRVAGYNVDAVVSVYPRVWTVDGDRQIPVAPEQLVSLVEVLSGPELKALAATIWSINESEPAKRVRAAGKGSTGARPRKRRSPASSESPSES